MFKRTTLAAATMLALAAPLTVQAQSSEWFSTQQTYEPSRYFDHRWYLTPFGTYTWTDNERKADDGWGGGLTVGRPVHPNWNLEFRTAYEELDGKSGGQGNWKNWTLTLDALWFPMRREGLAMWQDKSLHPYVVFGGGAINDDVGGRNAWSWALNAGGGIVWPFSNWGRLVADARYRWDSNNGHYGDGNNFGDIVASVGLQIPLGQAPRVAEAPRAAPPPPPAPAPVVKPAPPPPPPPAPKPTSRSFTLPADGLFAFDSAKVSDVARQRADDVIKALRAAGFTATSVKVIGHTDPIGTEAYNQKLSEQRARAFADFLVKEGVPASIITTEGRGESQVRVTEADCKAKGQAKTQQALIACLAPDRRVEVEVTGTQQP